MKILPRFPDRLKECRISKGLTQKQAAELFGVGTRHWRKYEDGERVPTFDRLMAIAEYFDVGLDWLTGRANNRDSHKT